MKTRLFTIIIITGLLGFFSGGDVLALKKNAVRTKHIKNNAITASKIRNGSITDDKISGSINPAKLDTRTLSCPEGFSIRRINQNGTVDCEKDDTAGSSTISTSDIKDGEVKTSDIADGAVTTNKIAPGAVTDDKIGGNISPSKIAGGAASLNFPGTQSFDSGTFQIDGANNRVGVNVAPSQALDVAGNAEVTGNYRYANSKTYYHFLNGNEFLNAYVTDDADWTRNPWEGYGYPTTGNGTYVVAPLHLPQGSDIMEFRCFYNDDSSGLNWNKIVARMYSRAHTSRATTMLAEINNNPSAVNNSTIYHMYDSSISGAGDPVHNGSYGYWVYVYLDPTGSGTDYSNLRFYGCRITYSLQEVSSP